MNKPNRFVTDFVRRLWIFVLGYSFLLISGCRPKTNNSLNQSNSKSDSSENMMIIDNKDNFAFDFDTTTSGTLSKQKQSIKNDTINLVAPEYFVDKDYEVGKKKVKKNGKKDTITLQTVKQIMHPAVAYGTTPDEYRKPNITVTDKP